MKDSKIKIRGSINGHGILLITKAVVGVRDGLLVDSLTYFGDDLEFREPSKIIAINKRDGRTYEFEAQSIGPVTTKYGHFHLIRCTQDGVVINRRKSERYDIDKLGVVRINGGDIRNALIYDISMRGIAFILDSNAKCRLGDHITASFRYDPDYFHFYTCEATVVRAFSIDKQIAIGCTLDSMGADLITLISNKRKEKNGIPIDEMLPVSQSSDEDIAEGKKIPVNYSPPMPAPQVMSPDEAADLIPERKEQEVMAARAEYVADMEELKTIEDRTPKKQAEVPKAPAKTGKKDAGKAKETGKAKDTIREQVNLHAEQIARLDDVGPAKKPAERVPASHTDLSLKDFDGYFNQKGRAVDEDLFTKNRNDGFLTPEQIADIIELERIHKE